MSYKYSDLNEETKTKIDALHSVFFNDMNFNEKEIKDNIEKSKANIEKYMPEVTNYMDLAMIITNNFGNRTAEKSGVVQALLAKEIETALGCKADFMVRDSYPKQTTLYEQFIGEGRFDKMFGREGYRKLFTGDYEGFMKDFKAKGVSDDEILKFNAAMNTSVFKGEYIISDNKFINELFTRVTSETKTAGQLWEERAHGIPEPKQEEYDPLMDIHSNAFKDYYYKKIEQLLSFEPEAPEIEDKPAKKVM